MFRVALSYITVTKGTTLLVKRVKKVAWLGQHQVYVIFFFLCLYCRCRTSQLPWGNRLCVSQWPLHRVPPGVWQQARLLWWIRWDRLWWVEIEIGSESILFCSGKFAHLELPYSSRLPSASYADHIASLPGSCNFNMEESQWEESCQLSQDTDDDFDWKISHRTRTPGTGPQEDHTPGQCIVFFLSQN